MKKYNISCFLKMNLSNIEIEANNKIEALNKLHKYCISELLNSGYVENYITTNETIEEK